MKDNKENLNNELNDDEMETVAGGAEKDWGWLQKRRFKSFAKKLGRCDEEIQYLIDKCTPKQVLEMMEQNRKQGTAEQLEEGRRILG